MKKYFLTLFTALTIIISSCTNGQTQNSGYVLSASAFDDKIRELPTSPIIDVRTPEEFFKGHLPNANNINWNGDDFQKHISLLDKSQPVLVYCLSGGRSAAAANKMRTDGFKEVYELTGGILKWRAANLPEEKNTASTTSGMTKQQFDALIGSDKIVLIDFYAEWCIPCKRMKPYLEEIANEMAGKVIVTRINVDDNQELCKELKIDALPVLQVYNNNAMSWSNVGFIEKAEVIKHLQ